MRYLILLVLIVGMVIVPVVSAQEVTETPAPTPIIVEPPPPDPVVEEPGDPPATTPENLLGQLFQLLKDGTFIVWAAAGVVLIVGLIKTLAGAAGISIQGSVAILITLVVQVLVWIAYSAANYFGQGDTFKSTYLQVIDVLRSLLPLAGAIFAGHVIYQQSAKRDVPILGYYYKPKPASTPPSPIVSSGEGRDWTAKP